MTSSSTYSSSERIPQTIIMKNIKVISKRDRSLNFTQKALKMQTRLMLSCVESVCLSYTNSWKWKELLCQLYTKSYKFYLWYTLSVITSAFMAFLKSTIKSSNTTSWSCFFSKKLKVTFLYGHYLRNWARKPMILKLLY